MANVTKVLRGVDDRWPNGTSVSLYRRAMREGRWVEDGAAIATASVTSGVLTLANVPEDAAGYIAVGANGARAATGAGAKLSWAASH
jgi:hypothetical protein